MATPKLDPYDEFLYENYAYPQTHINRLATLAILLGMTPVPIENCRVLELACGDGSNLLPMAYAFPSSRFLGIDRAAKPIASGREIIERLGLKNLELRQFDLMDMAEESGEFDYIIAHGLYSWVPPPVRDRLLQLCRSHLALLAEVNQPVYFHQFIQHAGNHGLQFLAEAEHFQCSRIRLPAGNRYSASEAWRRKHPD